MLSKAVRLNRIGIANKALMLPLSTTSKYMSSTLTSEEKQEKYPQESWWVF